VMRAAAGVLGLGVLMGAFVVGMLASAGVFGASAPADFPSGRPRSAPAGQVEQAERTAVAVGEAVRAGNVRWTVTDVHRTTELRKHTPPPSTYSGNFVVVSFTVENVSERPVTLTEESTALIDAEGREFPARAYLNSGYLAPEENVLFGERSLLHPGETAEGKVNFLVLEGASGLKARLGDTDPTVENEAYVDLGF
jgi:hypothetical protein